MCKHKFETEFVVHCCSGKVLLQLWESPGCTIEFASCEFFVLCGWWCKEKSAMNYSRSAADRAPLNSHPVNSSCSAAGLALLNSSLNPSCSAAGRAWLSYGLNSPCTASACLFCLCTALSRKVRYRLCPASASSPGHQRVHSGSTECTRSTHLGRVPAGC